MRRFKFTHQAQRFLSTHTAVYNLFNLGRHLISAKHYRFFRARSLPLGCSAPLRLGIAQRPHNRINIGSLVVLGHRFVNTRYTAAGPFLRFTFKADQGLLKRVAGRR